jgi:hypothetical protein
MVFNLDHGSLLIQANVYFLHFEGGLMQAGSSYCTYFATTGTIPKTFHLPIWRTVSSESHGSQSVEGLTYRRC